ncbi:hypothetical protein PB1_16449 [Bacillus methanolicus PB1]|uniref:Uncharacterized protein n=1 Tax=Bacillus methanolicus PB1 TaxID=997296 RepID=I3DY44_BACMT|nr:hypothetical protein [Bacillus methanolicus]EIJ79165.1 hypothetical protein PB1_16449 [Bacillus methanolicus PB1]
MLRAKFLQVKIFESVSEANSWLLENPDTEIIDIKVSGGDGDYVIGIIYRKEA